MANDKKQPKASNNIIAQVADRIKNSDNVLVALSKNPSIDELTAALGLTMMIDKMGKHSTAIFSGQVPNIIEFLEPEKTFEVNTNSLRDFIIALDKEKADHLRYKVEGDYVKVFITPYKTTIDESDMEFSHGDYNVDLVIALNVESTADLDAALSEYGRIMHDASSINISAAAPGKFGDIEWGNPGASSVSEMICQLGDELSGPDVALFDKTVSTALLAGIFSATNRFSNERTSSDTMQVAAKLMASGADQQLISSNVPVDILTQTVEETPSDGAMEVEKTPEEAESKEEAPEEEQPVEEPEEPVEEPAPAEPVDPTNLTIRHGAVDFSHLDKKEETPIVEKAEETPAEKEKKAAARAEAAKIIADREKEAAEKEAAKKEAAAKAAAEKEAREKEQKERDEAVRKEIEERIAKRNTTSGIVAANENDAVLKEQKKNLNPIGSDIKPPIPPRDYSAMMDAELKTEPGAGNNRLSNILMGDDSNVVAAPVNVEIPEEQPPLSAPIMPSVAAPEESAPIEAPAPVEQPVEELSMSQIISSTPDDGMTFEETPINAPRVSATPAPTPVEEQPVDMLAAPVEEQAPVEEAQPQNTGFEGLPMPDGMVLPPPPPISFDNFTPAASDNQPTAEQFAQQIQDTNPVMQTSDEPVEQVEPVMPQPVDMGVLETPAESTPAIEVAAPEVQQEPLPVSQGSAVAMQEQVYPVDPGTFRIPGM